MSLAIVSAHPDLQLSSRKSNPSWKSADNDSWPLEKWQQTGRKLIGKMLKTVEKLDKGIIVGCRFGDDSQNYWL